MIFKHLREISSLDVHDDGYPGSKSGLNSGQVSTPCFSQHDDGYPGSKKARKFFAG